MGSGFGACIARHHFRDRDGEFVKAGETRRIDREPVGSWDAAASAPLLHRASRNAQNSCDGTGAAGVADDGAVGAHTGLGILDTPPSSTCLAGLLPVHSVAFLP